MASVKTDSTSKKSKNTVKAPSAPSGGSNRGFLLGILAILVIGLAAVAFVVTNREGLDLDAPQTAAVEVEGTPLESMAQGGVSVDPASDPVIGTEPPTVSGTSFDGSEISITNDGRAKVIYFLAHWCSHCQAEVPIIASLIDEGAQPDDLDIYAVSTDVTPANGNYPPVRWFDLEGFQPPVIRDSDTSDAYKAFGPSGFPYAVYVNADNRIVARSSGELGGETMQALWEVTAGVRSADEAGSGADDGAETESTDADAGEADSQE